MTTNDQDLQEYYGLWEGNLPFLMVNLSSTEPNCKTVLDMSEEEKQKYLDWIKNIGVELITAAIMVKNEEEHIVQTLRSVIEHVDRVVIMDTGSTDNTVAVAKQFLDTCDVPHSICQERIFRDDEDFDFSVARNHMLHSRVSAFYTTTHFILLLDAHDRVEKMEYLRLLCAREFEEGSMGRGQHYEYNLPPRYPRYCKDLKKLQSDINKEIADDNSQFLAYELPVVYSFSVYFETDEGTERQPMLRLLRTEGGYRRGIQWKYVGPVHEILVPTASSCAQRVDIPPDFCRIVQDKRTDSNGSQERWVRDIKILEKRLNDPLAVYYLAKTLMAQRKCQEAVPHLERRLDMVREDLDMAHNQRFNTLLMLAFANHTFLVFEQDFQKKRLYYQNIRSCCEKAIHLKPHRAEVYDLAARSCFEIGDNYNALELAEKALACDKDLVERAFENYDLSLYQDGRYATYTRILSEANNDAALEFVRQFPLGAETPLMQKEYQRLVGE